MTPFHSRTASQPRFSTYSHLTHRIRQRLNRAIDRADVSLRCPRCLLIGIMSQSVFKAYLISGATSPKQRKTKLTVNMMARRRSRSGHGASNSSRCVLCAGRPYIFGLGSWNKPTTWSTTPQP